MDRRLRLVLIVAVFFGVPALVTLALINSDQAVEARRGDQPGGPIRGRVLGPDGQGIGGAKLELLLDPSEEGPPAAVGARGRSDPDGRFELQAPPLSGRYLLVAGGGTWQHAARAYSFVGRKADEKELELRLIPGCELVARFTHADGSPASAGSYDLQGRAHAWFAFFGAPPVRRQGQVQGGELHLEGLPPMKARLFVRFDSGESLDLELDLEPGRTEKTLRL